MVTNQAKNLRPQELEAIFSISKVVSESVDLDETLDAIIRIIRPVFIFDNAALYLMKEEDEDIAPTFARAIGRGRTSEDDLVWGDIAAREAVHTGTNYVYQTELQSNSDRMSQRFYLGMPMVVGGNIIGALVFVRFGGPYFKEDQINLAGFVAILVSQLLNSQRMIDRIANLEAERRLQKLQEDFIATMTHELNTPLGFIKGYTTTLLREDTDWDTDTQVEFLTIIDEEADRLSQLIDKLLDSSRLQAGTLDFDFKQVHFNAVWNGIQQRILTHYPDQRIIVEPANLDLTVSVDMKRFEQVIDNLITNAIKYAPNSEIRLFAKKNGQTVSIVVKDYGPGIREEHLDQLFKRFYRVPERSAGVRGSGLGLFICDQIIRAHNGNITIQSEVGKGTAFYIQLPIRQTQVPAN